MNKASDLFKKKKKKLAPWVPFPVQKKMYNIFPNKKPDHHGINGTETQPNCEKRKGRILQPYNRQHKGGGEREREPRWRCADGAAPMVPASTVLTLLGFCASVLFIVFVCSRLVCALTRRVRRGRRPSPSLPRFPPVAVRAGHSFHVPFDRQGHAVGGGGVDPAAVAAFPTRAFSAAGCPRGEAADASAMYVPLGSRLPIAIHFAPAPSVELIAFWN